MTFTDIKLVFYKKKINITANILNELFSIYGIGWYKSLTMAKSLGILNLKKNLNFKNISEKKLVIINFFLKDNLKLDISLRLYKKGARSKYMTFFNFKRLHTIFGLPVRGQRTQTNHKTARFFKNK